MNGWYFWIYIKVGISITALIVCILSIVIVWRLRGIWQWQRSLDAELRALKKKAEMSNGYRRLAMLQVIRYCDDIHQSRSPDPHTILHLDNYLHNIARCYHSDSNRPELCLTLGQTIATAKAMVERLDSIIKRKGLRRFAHIRIKHIHKALVWYRRIYHHHIFGWLLRHQSIVSRLMHIRRFFLMDPFSLLAYFSNRLTILIVTRTLLLDLYLFIGLLAIDAYNPQSAIKRKIIDNDHLAETLATLYDSNERNEWQNDPEVSEIRSQLVGIPRRIIQPPGVSEWRQSISQAANILAARHFDQSKIPLEEAALGPIVLQTRSFLNSIAEMSHYTGLKHLFAVRLESLYDVHTFVGNLSTWHFTSLVQKAWDGYRTLRWPFKVYRWIRHSSPSGMAMGMGWEILRKTIINFLARFTFDKSCKEIDKLYYGSKNIKKVRE
jgi:hypothetical protein